MPTYVIRAFGGTLILGSGPTVPVPSVLLLANFREGEQAVAFRNGHTYGCFQDGDLEAAFADGHTIGLFRSGDATGESR